MSTVRQISLYYKDSKSDKEYHIQVEDIGNDNFVTNFQYGPRGGTLTSGTKTQKPVSSIQAHLAFEKVLKEKKAKGYTEGEAGTPYSSGDKDGKQSEYHVQLLNPIADLKHIINDNDWCAQEKYDGKCMLLRYSEGKVTAINKLGLECGVAQPIIDAFTSLILEYTGAVVAANEFVVHGETVGDTFYAFDVLIWNGVDRRDDSYINRHATLLHFDALGSFVPAPLVLRFKQKFVDGLRDAGKEGAVFKRIDAPYKAGRPNSGGTQLKYKFVESCTVQVSEINAKRSVRVVAWANDGGETLVEMGNVTIPPNYSIPKVGDFVEVWYLYVGKGGSLYQPVYKGVRDDKDRADSSDSLKYKDEAKGARA